MICPLEQLIVYSVWSEVGFKPLVPVCLLSCVDESLSSLGSAFSVSHVLLALSGGSRVYLHSLPDAQSWFWPRTPLDDCPFPWSSPLNFWLLCSFALRRSVQPLLNCPPLKSVLFFNNALRHGVLHSQFQLSPFSLNCKAPCHYGLPFLQGRTPVPLYQIWMWGHPCSRSMHWGGSGKRLAAPGLLNLPLQAMSVHPLSELEGWRLGPQEHLAFCVWGRASAFWIEGWVEQ